MSANSYMRGKRTYSHCVKVGDDEVILYFIVEMEKKDVNGFAKLLNVKDKVEYFYACVVVNNMTIPRTFVAYRNKDGEDRELFNISTGLRPVSILCDVLAEV